MSLNRWTHGSHTFACPLLFCTIPSSFRVQLLCNLLLTTPYCSRAEDNFHFVLPSKCRRASFWRYLICQCIPTNSSNLKHAPGSHNFEATRSCGCFRVATWTCSSCWLETKVWLGVKSSFENDFEVTGHRVVVAPTNATPARAV